MTQKLEKTHRAPGERLALAHRTTQGAWLARANNWQQTTNRPTKRLIWINASAA